MRCKGWKLAVLLAVLLMMPAGTAWAETKETTIAETVAAIAGTIAESATESEETKEAAVAETQEPFEETAEAETEESVIVETEGEEAKAEETIGVETTAAKVMKTVAETVAETVGLWVTETQTDSADAENQTEGWNNYPIATPSNVTKPKTVEMPGDEVKFNTGNHVWSVVSYEDFWDNNIGDGYFEEDGSYTINIPEENPFFPYEVQFTYRGKTVNQWFMTPEDCVEIGGPYAETIRNIRELKF